MDDVRAQVSTFGALIENADINQDGRLNWFEAVLVMGTWIDQLQQQAEQGEEAIGQSSRVLELVGVGDLVAPPRCEATLPDTRSSDVRQQDKDRGQQHERHVGLEAEVLVDDARHQPPNEAQEGGRQAEADAESEAVGDRHAPPSASTLMGSGSGLSEGVILART